MVRKSLKIKRFGVLELAPKPLLPSPPPAHPLGTIFAGKMPVFSIHISITPKTPKKNTKPLKIKGLRLWSGFGVALEWLWSFLHFCKKSTILNPHPTLSLAQHHHKTVENQALHDAN